VKQRNTIENTHKFVDREHSMGSDGANIGVIAEPLPLPYTPPPSVSGGYKLQGVRELTSASTVRSLLEEALARAATEGTADESITPPVAADAADDNSAESMPSMLAMRAAKLRERVSEASNGPPPGTRGASLRRSPAAAAANAVRSLRFSAIACASGESGDLRGTQE